MKATGIIRRVDDLGRIVIPRKIRRTLDIREGDPMEIYTDNNAAIVLRKYDMALPVSEAVQRLKAQIVDLEDFNLSQECRKALRDKLSEMEDLLKKEEPHEN